MSIVEWRRGLKGDELMAGRPRKNAVALFAHDDIEGSWHEYIRVDELAAAASAADPEWPEPIRRDSNRAGRHWSQCGYFDFFGSESTWPPRLGHAVPMWWGRWSDCRVGTTEPA